GFRAPARRTGPPERRTQPPAGRPIRRMRHSAENSCRSSGRPSRCGSPTTFLPLPTHVGESHTLMWNSCERTTPAMGSDRAAAHDPALDPAFPLHRGGKIEVRPAVRIRDAEGLALAY